MLQKQNRLAIIPARGGSKRLPRKNIIDFRGKPMLAWSIESAQKSNLFQDVYVSTEDEEIGDIASQYGAIWAKRPPSLANDTATVSDVCLNFLNHPGHSHFDIIVVLYAASPLRTADDIRQTVSLIENKNADLAMTVTELPFDPREALVVDKNMNADVWQKDLIDIKRQKRESLMIDAGSIYAARVPIFKRLKEFYGPNLMVHSIPASRAVDIDTHSDLALANFLAQAKPIRPYKQAS